MTKVDLRRDDGLGPDALAMIAESEAELASLYAPEHRYAFSPQELIDAHVRFVTAHDGDNLVGCGGMAPCDGYGELKRIFVTRAARNRGLAGLIVAGLEQIARDDGFAMMRLETGLASPDALALYRRLGYQETPAFGKYEENGSSVFMEKPL